MLVKPTHVPDVGEREGIRNLAQEIKTAGTVNVISGQLMFMVPLPKSSTQQIYLFVSCSATPPSPP